MKTGHIIELPKCRIRKMTTGSNGSFAIFSRYRGHVWVIDLIVPNECGKTYFVGHLALPLHADAIKIAHRIAKGHQTRYLKKAQTELNNLTGGTQ